MSGSIQGLRGCSHAEVSLIQDQARWTRLKSVFTEALDQPESAREAFVRTACGDDRELESEVLSLLASDRGAGSFCESPAAVLLRVESRDETSRPRLLPGTRLGVYEILEFLRAGGMGAVYRARHTVLGREVAIKTVAGIVDGDARRRLLREARHASILKHPNICTIHEVGEAGDTPFIVMELVDGRSLSEIIRDDPPPVDTALGYAIAITDALEHAHEHGIVHRDLKSGNVMVDGTGRAVVLDFGLAKRLPGPRGGTGGDSITGFGAVAGTLSHMAPEVLMGGAADTRSDVWSLGVLLFELMAGTVPFAGHTPFDTSRAILEEQPRWPDRRVPMTLRLIIERCLVKDASGRYQRPGEVRDALERVSRRRAWSVAAGLLMKARRRTLVTVLLAALATPVIATAGKLASDRAGPSVPAIRTLAVLPLENCTPDRTRPGETDPAEEYLAEGVTAGVISELAGLPDLTVAPGPSVAKYAVRCGEARAGGLTMAELGEALGVDGILDGLVVRDGDSVRLSAQLILAATGEHVWREGMSFAGGLQDVSGLHSRVAGAVARSMQSSRIEPAPVHGPVSPETYTDYLKARFLWTDDEYYRNHELALEHLERLIARDTTFAPAYSALADIYVHMDEWRDVPEQVAHEKALDAATKAVALDRGLAEAHASLGHVLMHEERWTEAERSFLWAIELEPSNANARIEYAFQLTALERHDEAIEHAVRAVESNPLAPRVLSFAGHVLQYAGRHDEAIAMWQRSLEYFPDAHTAHFHIAVSHLLQGRRPEGLSWARRGIERSGSPPWARVHLAHCLALAGEVEEARRVLQSVVDSSSSELNAIRVAAAYAVMGEADVAFQWFERARAAGDGWMMFLRVDPAWNPLRTDPRFRYWLRQMNLEVSGSPLPANPRASLRTVQLPEQPR